MHSLYSLYVDKCTNCIVYMLICAFIVGELYRTYLPNFPLNNKTISYSTNLIL